MSQRTPFLRRSHLSQCTFLASFLLAGLLSVVYQSEVVADEFAGKWRGRWTTETQGNRRGHEGSLRMNLRPQADGSYQGTFVGRFAVVIPYAYRARVYPTPDGLVASKRLGFLGNYDMNLVPAPNGSLRGGWTAAGERGGIFLSR